MVAPREPERLLTRQIGDPHLPLCNFRVLSLHKRALTELYATMMANTIATSSMRNVRKLEFLVAIRETGKYVTSTVGGESYQTFFPAPLPPDPPLALDGELLQWLEKANRAIGRLDGISEMLPDTHLFLYQYVRKVGLPS